MKINSDAIFRILVVLLLILNIAIFGCATAGVWMSPKTPLKNNETVFCGQKISVMVLDEEQIAIFASGEKNNSFNDLATLYRFKKATYESIKSKIENVEITEVFTSNSDKKNITASRTVFKIKLSGGIILQPEYVGATLAARSEKEVLFDDPRIIFFRRVTHFGIPTTDMSWLWKIPLTPVALGVDVVLTGVFAATAVVASPYTILHSLSHK